MPKFFRHIRKTLTEHPSKGRTGNKVRAYILYALGEIMLVVLGILIALQVNTWNANRKMANEDQAILTQLLEDLKFAKVESERFIVRENKDAKRLKLVLGNPQVESAFLQEPNQDKLFYSAVWDLSLDVPFIITYMGLQNTGDTGKIRNSVLRAKLSEMSLKILSLKSLIGDRLSVHQKRIDNIAEYELNFLPLLAAWKKLEDIYPGMPNDYVEIMQKTRVRNLLGIKLDQTIMVLKVRKDLDRQLAQIIEMVESEIN